MADHDALCRRVVLGEDTNSLVPSCSRKVVAMGSPENTEHRAVMGLVHAQTSPNIKRPEANLPICRTREEKLGACIWLRAIDIGVDIPVKVTDRVGKGNTINRGRMPDELTVVHLEVFLGSVR